MDSKKIKILIAVLLAITLVFVVMSFLKGNKTDQLITPENLNTSAGNQDREILGLLLDLKSIKLDTNIFSEKSFQALEDFGVNLPDEPTKRPNPFAPIGFDNPGSLDSGQ